MTNAWKWGLGLVAAVGVGYVLLRDRLEGDSDIDPAERESYTSPDWLMTKASYGGAARPSIFAFGDSLGLGMSKYGFQSQLAKLGYPFAYDAIGGTTIDYWVSPEKNGASRIENRLASTQPDVVIASLGTNNAGPVYDAKRLPDTIDAVYAAVDGSPRAPTLVWVLPPPLPQQRLPHQQQVRDAIIAANARARRKALLIDPSTMTFARSSDEIHATPQGYADWSGQVFARMKHAGVV